MKSTLTSIALTLVAWTAAYGQCVQGDINGDGVVNGIDLSFVLTNWGQTCPAVITSVTPNQGLPGGGTAITIEGSQLGGVQSVTIGGIAATDVVSVSPTTITAITPPSKATGVRDVVVTTTAGTAILVGGFTYSEVEWATIIEATPDPAVVTAATLRNAIIASGLPWRVRDNASQIEMVLVPSGTFMMGCSPSLLFNCGSDEQPVHSVTITQPFYVGRYEVTQAEWTAVMESNPSQYQGLPDSAVRPVEGVSWNMIQVFESETGLRLPTEAEWELACRAGTTTAYASGSNADSSLAAMAWFDSESGSGPKPVGLKNANALGLHDMHGNVWEWVEDRYGSGYYSQSPPIDPAGPSGGSYRVLRGGNWYVVSGDCRSSHRFFNVPEFQGNVYTHCGFRVARNP